MEPQPLPERIALFLAHRIRAFLPPTTNDQGDELPHPDFAAALECALSLAPATLAEAERAALCIAGGSLATTCTRLSQRRPNEVSTVLGCTARVAGLLREVRALHTALERAQAQRRTQEAEAKAAALVPPPPEPAPPGTALAAAELYARQHPKGAKLIRRLGRLPDRFNVGRVPPDVVQALATGTTPILRGLDAKPPHRLAAAR